MSFSPLNPGHVRHARWIVLHHNGLADPFRNSLLDIIDAHLKAIDAPPEPPIDPLDRSPELDMRIANWLASVKRPGRPSCPCGFVGGARNIRQHRLNCAIWRYYTRTAARES